MRRGQVFPGQAVVVLPVDAASGVPDQPMGDAETKRGAVSAVPLW